MKNRVIFNPSSNTLLDIGPPVFPRMNFNRLIVGIGGAFIFGCWGVFAFTGVQSGLGFSNKYTSPGSGWAMVYAWLFLVFACGAYVGLGISLIWNCAVRETVRREPADSNSSSLKVTRSLFGKISYTKTLALNGPVSVTVEPGQEKNNDFKPYGFWDMGRPGTTFVSVSVGKESLAFGVCLSPADVNKIAEHLRVALNTTAGALPGV